MLYRESHSLYILLYVGLNIVQVMRCFHENVILCNKISNCGWENSKNGMKVINVINTIQLRT